MTNNKVSARWSILALIIFVVALTRLIPYLFDISEVFNFSPIGAIALFGGAYFANRGRAFLFPLLALWVSNILLNNIFLSQYYDGFSLFANWEVYATMVLIVGLGMLLLKKVTVSRVLGAGLGAAVLFFLVTNFMVWSQGAYYPMTFEGLITCYEMAIPFFRNTLFGNLFYCALMFGAFEWLKYRYPKLALQKVRV